MLLLDQRSPGPPLVVIQDAPHTGRDCAPGKSSADRLVAVEIVDVSGLGQYVGTNVPGEDLIGGRVVDPADKPCPYRGTAQLRGGVLLDEPVPDRGRGQVFAGRCGSRRRLAVQEMVPGHEEHSQEHSDRSDD